MRQRAQNCTTDCSSRSSVRAEVRKGLKPTLTMLIASKEESGGVQSIVREDDEERQRPTLPPEAPLRRAGRPVGGLYRSRSKCTELGAATWLMPPRLPALRFRADLSKGSVDASLPTISGDRGSPRRPRRRSSHGARGSAAATTEGAKMAVSETTPWRPQSRETTPWRPLSRGVASAAATAAGAAAERSRIRREARSRELEGSPQKIHLESSS